MHMSPRRLGRAGCALGVGVAALLLWQWGGPTDEHDIANAAESTAAAEPAAAPEVAAADAEAAANDAPAGGSAAPAEGATLQPINDIRKTRYVEALRGLLFVDGRVEIDEAEAAAIAEPGTIEEARALMAEGEALRLGNNFTEAVGVFRTAVLIAPDSAETYAGLGRALMAKRDGPKALAALETSLDIDPGQVDVLAEVARAQQWGGDFEASIESYNAVLEAEPERGDVHRRLAVLWYYLNEDALAWDHVHAAEDLGEAVPPQFRVLLRQRMAEPTE